MKRTIGIILIYILQIALLVIFLIPDFRDFVVSYIPFLNNVWNGYKGFGEWFGETFGLSGLKEVSSRLFNMVSLILFNIIFTIVYHFVVFIFVKISKSRRKKKLLNNNLTSYTLSEEEKAKFNYKLYEKKFSIKGFLSYIVLIIILLLITFIRFDKQICQVDEYREGYFTIYSNYIRPFLTSLHGEVANSVDAITYYYIIFINQIIDIIKIEFIEYVIISFFVILFFVLWTVIVVLLSRANRTHAAKRRAKIAREKYITKMEKYELSSKEKVEERISSKAREILGDAAQNSILEEDASSISEVHEKYIGTDASSIRKQANYIDDISTGVTDLGVAGTGDEEAEPIERKIPIFVGDEEVEISLDREPFVEIEEEVEFEDTEEDEMPFFEKYSPELTDYSYIDENLLMNQVDVVDESESEKETIFATVKEYEETNEVQNEQENFVEIPEDQVIAATEEKSEDNINEVEVNALNVQKEPKKKKIKPIDIKKRSAEERFKNAKKKYLVIPQNKPVNALEIKKRNLIRRKYKK